MKTDMFLKIKKATKNSNCLDLIPVVSADIKWKLLNDSCVELTINNKGFINKIAQTFFSTPETSKIKLDKYGSCVWKNIDSVNNIEDIAIVLKDNFGEDAEPLYERLVQFVKILKNEGYINWKKPIK